MAKVLLLRQQPIGPRRVQSLPHYGLGIIGTILDKAGHSVRIIDNTSYYVTFSHGELLEKAKVFGPDIIGFNINILNAKYSYELIAELKRQMPDAKLLAGGIHMKHAAGEALDYGVDVVVNGEGEPVVQAIVETLLRDKRKTISLPGLLKKIDGISYRDDNGRYVFPSQESLPYVEDLDTIPFIKYELFNLDDFIRSDADKALISQIITQRGCPFPCNFCSDKFLRTNVRDSSSGYIISYMKYLIDKYGVKNVTIHDDNFTLKRSKTLDICEKIIENGLNKHIRIRCQTNINAALDKEVVNALRRANVVDITIGIERISKFAQEKINKKYDIEKMFQTVALMKKTGINVCPNMLLGFPFESSDIILEEERLFKRFSDIGISYVVNTLIPIPGTEYYDNYKSCQKWYLNEKYTNFHEPYYYKVLFLGIGDLLLDDNIFSIDIKTVKQLKRVRNKANFGYFIKLSGLCSGYKKLTIMAVQYFDAFLGVLSYVCFKYNPQIEKIFFSGLGKIRFWAGVKLYSYLLKD